MKNHLIKQKNSHTLLLEIVTDIVNALTLIHLSVDKDKGLSILC